jgi:hypothetical protein
MTFVKPPNCGTCGAEFPSPEIADFYYWHCEDCRDEGRPYFEDDLGYDDFPHDDRVGQVARVDMELCAWAKRWEANVKAQLGEFAPTFDEVQRGQQTLLDGGS